jgi:phosphoglycolate phosphatase
MIGDTTHDLQMALNADCASVGVSYGAHEPGAFTVLNPLHVAHSVQGLQDWLVANA